MSVEQAKALEHLRDALRADTSEKKNYHIRTALQLLTVAAD
ncbi:hypothetical protein [Haloarcula amylovorans]|nr:hypothetical protein [Halomicroarcula amylolytica]